MFWPSIDSPIPKPFTVFARITVGCALCSTAALYAVYTFIGSWPPRVSAQICSSVQSATIAAVSGYLPKNSLRTNAPSFALNAW